MVSKASEDLPEPDKPVSTVKVSRGISTSTFLRLCSRAPRMEMFFSMAGGAAVPFWWRNVRCGDGTSNRQGPWQRSHISWGLTRNRLEHNRNKQLCTMHSFAGHPKVRSSKTTRQGHGGKRQQGDSGGQSGQGPGSAPHDLRRAGGEPVGCHLGNLAGQGLRREKGKDRMAPGGHFQ